MTTTTRTKPDPLAEARALLERGGTSEQFRAAREAVGARQAKVAARLRDLDDANGALSRAASRDEIAALTTEKAELDAERMANGGAYKDLQVAIQRAKSAEALASVKSTAREFEAALTKAEEAAKVHREALEVLTALHRRIYAARDAVRAVDQEAVQRVHIDPAQAERAAALLFPDPPGPRSQPPAWSRERFVKEVCGDDRAKAHQAERAAERYAASGNDREATRARKAAAAHRARLAS